MANRCDWRAAVLTDGDTNVCFHIPPISGLNCDERGAQSCHFPSQQTIPPSNQLILIQQPVVQQLLCNLVDSLLDIAEAHYFGDVDEGVALVDHR